MTNPPVIISGSNTSVASHTDADASSDFSTDLTHQGGSETTRSMGRRKVIWDSLRALSDGYVPNPVLIALTLRSLWDFWAGEERATLPDTWTRGKCTFILRVGARRH